MREILFRGKLEFSPGWIVGGYCQWSDIKDNRKHQIISKVGFHNDVKPDTVGQFTGFTDKKNVYIYEGDIIQYDYFGDEGELRFSNMQIFWNKGTASFCYDDSYKSDKTSYQELNEEFCKDVKVVGNIYEHFKLLAVSEADA